MTTLTLDSIAIDCPDPEALASFYARLLGVESGGDWFRIPGGNMNVWFQKVDHYEPPTWPTQERGQQMHFDFHSDDREAMVARAVELGARRVDWKQKSYETVLDPAGHPFCICDLED